MTPSEIIDAAREAGWTANFFIQTANDGSGIYCPTSIDDLQRFAAIIEAKQREKDAQIVNDQHLISNGYKQWNLALECVAKAIRGQE